jgi:hypothetical protein
MPQRAIALSAVVVVLGGVLGLAGCTDEEADVGFGEGLGTPENPVPSESSYAVRTRIDLGFPVAMVDSAASEYAAFAQNPARTLLAPSGTLSTPALELYAALPTALDERLEGWINIEVDKARLASKTPRQFASEVVNLTRGALTDFTLESALSIMPDGVVHSLTALNVRPAGLDVVVPLGGLKADVAMQRADVTVGEAGALWLGDQTFRVGFGNHVWHGLNLASTSLFGASLEQALVMALDCRTLAQAVAARCYNGSCVGNVIRLEAICETGTRALAARLAERIAAFELRTVRFTQGTATLVDDNRDGIADRIVDGRWQAEIDGASGPGAAGDSGGTMRATSGTFYAGR